jgi:hypothetical protein
MPSREISQLSEAMRSSGHFAASEPVYWLPNAVPATSALTVRDRCLLWDTLGHDSAGSGAFLVGADHVVALLALAEAKHWPQPQAADPRPPALA